MRSRECGKRDRRCGASASLRSSRKGCKSAGRGDRTVRPRHPSRATTRTGSRRCRGRRRRAVPRRFHPPDASSWRSTSLTVNTRKIAARLARGDAWLRFDGLAACRACRIRTRRSGRRIRYSSRRRVTGRVSAAYRSGEPCSGSPDRPLSETVGYESTNFIRWPRAPHPRRGSPRVTQMNVGPQNLGSWLPRYRTTQSRCPAGHGC